MNVYKNLTNKELRNKKKKLMETIEEFEREIHEINNGALPSVCVDNFMQDDYKDLLSKEIELLLEIKLSHSIFGINISAAILSASSS